MIEKPQNVENEEKNIPLDFIRKFLTAKGWKWLYTVWCECSIDILETTHPIRFLFEHIQKGHEPSFDCCHTWNRQVGRDTGEFEEWYQWWTYGWNKQLNDFEVIESYHGLEGWEEDVTPLRFLERGG